MKQLLVLIFIATASFSTVYTQEVSKTPQDSSKTQNNNSTTQTPALDINFEWGPAFDNEKAETKKSFLDVINSALVVVEMFQPEGDDLFNWTGDRAVLKDKTFEIYYTNSNDEYINQLIINNEGLMPDNNTDATTVLARAENNDIRIFLCLFKDRIFWDENRAERADGFTRLTVALAHEIYGNTQMHLRHDCSTNSTTTLPSRKQEEINAFTTSINFINKVLDSLKNGTLSSLPNKDKLIGDFNSAFTREKAGLESWQKASDDTK